MGALTSLCRLLNSLAEPLNSLASWRQMRHLVLPRSRVLLALGITPVEATVRALLAPDRNTRQAERLEDAISNAADVRRALSAAGPPYDAMLGVRTA